MRVWDLGLRRPVRSLNPSTAGNPNPPSLNGDGSRMAEQLDTGQGSIDLLSVETGATTFVGASDCLFSAQAISDDGAIVAALDQCPNRLTTWALTPVGTHARQLPLAGATATGPLRFSPDAKHLAIGNVNGRGGIAIVDATGGQIIATLVGHATRIVDVAYSPDGRLLVTASRDGTARVWNPSTGRLLRTLDHPHPVFGVAFSPDSRTIATFDEGGIIRLWDACTDCENPDALLALARKRVTRGLTPAERRSYGG